MYKIPTFVLVGTLGAVSQQIENFQGCIQSVSLRPGTHLFFCWTQRILNKGSILMQKTKSNVMQITNSRKKQCHTICKFVFRETTFIS